MTYLSTTEVAEIKGCTTRYVRQLAQHGKIECTYADEAANNRTEYRFPLSALSEKEQLCYENRRRKELGLAPLPAPKKENKPDPRQITLRDLDGDQRRDAALWCRIIQDWLRIREEKAPGLGGKGKVDDMFCSSMKLQYPELNISPDILYRKLKAYRAGDLSGLVDKRGGHNKGHSSAPQYMIDAFLTMYLHDNQLPISRCYALLQTWVQDYYPEAYADMPSERTFRREAEKVPYAVVQYMRFGDKAFSDKCLPYIERLYDDLHANDVWIADNHTFDFFTSGENGKPHRLYLTAFTDAKSGIMVGWNLTDNPSSDSTLLALRHGILRFGVPRAIYVDNGSEFLVSDIGGRGHRRKKDWHKAPLPPTILDFLHIEMHNAIVRNAKVKPIERTFCTFKNHFSRAIETFCGGTVVEQKESLKWILKRGELPTDLQIKAALGVFIDGDYNVDPYGGKEVRYKGKRRIETLRAFADFFAERGQTLGVALVGNDGIREKIEGKSREQYRQVNNRAWQRQQLRTMDVRREDIAMLFPILEGKTEELNLLYCVARTAEGIRGAVRLFSNAYDAGAWDFNGIVRMAKMMHLDLKGADKAVRA